MKFTTVKEAHEFYCDFLKDAQKKGSEQVGLGMRALCLKDLYFLLYYVLNRKDLDHQWLFERCVEIQQEPNGYLDLWAREHYKTTIITFGLTIQDILFDPEITIGLFSFNRPSAKGFLRQIKWELESNQTLKTLFQDILWEDPQKKSPKWSEDDGLLVKRNENPKEATIEAWGLIDAMPTSRHYKIRVYDDIITERQVSNPDMIKKVTQALELSLNLGSEQPSKRYGVGNIQRYAGTRYHLNDPYGEIIKRGIVKKRQYPATIDGTFNSKPVLWPQETIERKRREMGPYIFGCQILLDPKADQMQGFKNEWLKYWKRDNWDIFNTYLLCDPAGEKKKENDYTVMLIIGLGEDENYYLIDGVRDRLNLTERTQKFFEFHRTYKPTAVGYEKYGKDSDIEHIRYIQEKENYRFPIIELGGSTAKRDRIGRLIPIFEQGRFYIPTHLHYIDYQHKDRDLVDEFVNDEFISFPVSAHDDLLDCTARILSETLGALFPKRTELKLKTGIDRRSNPKTAWMAA